MLYFYSGYVYLYAVLCIVQEGKSIYGFRVIYVLENDSRKRQ